MSDNSPLLSVYAISLDSNLLRWKEAIEKDGSQSFSHTILRSDNPDFEKINKLFNIQQIPANFLLDQNYKIVAMDLRGEELGKKLKELSVR